MKLERKGNEWFVNDMPAPFDTKEKAEIYGLRHRIAEMQTVMEALQAKHASTLDVTAPTYVDIVIRHDRKVVWVNVNGICVFRACRINELSFSAPKRTHPRD